MSQQPMQVLWAGVVMGSGTSEGVITRVFCFIRRWGCVRPPSSPSSPSQLSTHQPGTDKGIVHRAVASGALDALIPMLRSPSGKEREVAAKVGQCMC